MSIQWTLIVQSILKHFQDSYILGKYRIVQVGQYLQHAEEFSS